MGTHEQQGNPAGYDRELLEAVLNNTASSIMLLKPVKNDANQIVDFECLFTNTQTLTSVNRDALTGKYFTQEFPGAKGSDLLDAYVRVMETGNPYQAEVDITPYGTPVTAQVFARKIDGDLLITYFDVTEQKSARLELLLQNERLNAAQTLGHIGDFYYNASDNSVYWSDEIHRIMSIPIGTTLSFEDAIALYIPADRDRLISLATTCMNKGMGFSMNATFCPVGNHELRHLFIKASAVKDSDGTIKGIRGIVQDVTDRKKNEQEILRLKDEIVQNAEHKYRVLFNSMDEGYCIIQIIYDNGGKATDWRFLEVNPAFEKHNGLHAATGKTMRELNPDIEQKWVNIYAAVAETGESIRFEEDSEALHRVFSLYAYRIGQPEERKVAVLFTNITERKQNEKRQDFLLHLTDSLRPLSDPILIQEAIAHLTIAHFRADRCYYCEIDNGHAVISRDAAMAGLPSVTGIYPLGSFPLLQAVIDNGKPFVVNDIRNEINIDEELRQLCIQLQVISYIDVPLIKNGTAAGILCITNSQPCNWTSFEINLAEEVAERTLAAVERAKTEASLRESEAYNSAMVDQTNVGIFGADLSGKISFLNAKAEQMFGMAAGEAAGMSLLDITVAEFRETTLQKFRLLVTEGRAFEAEKKMTRKDGTEFWANVSVSAIRNGGNQPKSIVGVIIDVTDRKEADDALHRNEELLKQLLKQRDEFISIASHELKTPVTSVKTYAELIAETLAENGDEENGGLIAKLNNQIDRLNGLVTDLLDITRINDGGIVYNRESIDLNELLNERIAELRMAIKNAISYEQHGKLEVHADKERIAQVLTNLVSNAAKYSQANTEIRIVCKADGANAVVSITDSGIGIPEDVIHNIFDRFYRVDSHTLDTYPGMGLGLYISAEIMKNHGGSISVRSKEGEGSTFKFSLPLKSQAV